jgi:hypothetical protein
MTVYLSWLSIPDLGSCLAELILTAQWQEWWIYSRPIARMAAAVNSSEYVATFGRRFGRSRRRYDWSITMSSPLPRKTPRQFFNISLGRRNSAFSLRNFTSSAFSSLVTPRPHPSINLGLLDPTAQGARVDVDQVTDPPAGLHRADSPACFRRRS